MSLLGRYAFPKSLSLKGKWPLSGIPPEFWSDIIIDPTYYVRSFGLKVSQSGDPT